MMRADEQTPGLFIADASSQFVVCIQERISMRLDKPDTNIKRGVDGVKVLLTQEPMHLIGFDCAFGFRTVFLIVHGQAATWVSFGYLPFWYDSKRYDNQNHPS